MCDVTCCEIGELQQSLNMDASVLEESSFLDPSNLTDADSSMNDVDLRVKDRSFGLMMPAKVRTMRDYEQQLNVLRKENLHLRLRMFFLEQGKGRHCSVSTGGEYEAFVQQVQNDMKTLVNEVDKRNALIQKNWVTIEQQHEAIEKLTEEKLAAEKELFTLQTKALLAEGANKDHQKMANMISELEQQKKQLEQDMKALRKRLGELEERDIPGMRKEIDKRNIAIQGLTVQVVKKDKAIAKLESQMSVLSSTQPLTDTFLERLDRSLASSDVDSAVAARDQFRHDFSFITNRKKNSSDASPVSSVAMSALKEQVCSLEAELKMKEAAIESMDTEMSRLKSALRASQEQCGDLEGEMERSTQVHMRICAEKDKLLETLQNRVHQLQENVQEVQTLKTRQSALERECNSLHAALHEKDNFIEELLTERNRAAFDTEKSFQELIHSMRQKDEHIEVLQTKLNGADVEAHYSAIASPSECSLLDPTTLKSPHHQEDPKEAGSFNLIELSAGEASIQKPQDSAKPDTESLDALDRGSSSKLLPIDRDLIEELSEFYEILCKASQDAEVLPEVKAPTVPQAECSSELRLNFVRELKSTLQHVCERGFALVTRSEDGLCESSGSTVATRGGTDNKIRNLQICGGDQLDPAVSEKLQEILTVLSIEPTAESSSGWHVRDLLAHLDSFLQKIRSNGSELSQSHAVQEKEMAQLRENKVLRERLLDSIAAITKVKSSEQGVGTEFSDLKEEILRELAPVLECVNFLHGEVDTMSVSTGEKQDRCDKKSASIEELVYMVDESGRLVPVPESAVPSPEPGACREAVHAKDVGQQTEDAAAAEELEQLRNELNKSRAQVKFLQKSLKESFSVRMTDSNKPLIEIDQNRPVPEGSPNKSANRRWRKQLTNQKMSEFGLSENVFELQEEIFFLVLRIEDLERQLGRGTSAVPHEHSEKSQAPPAAEPKAKALQARCEALEQQVQDMQEASTVLLCRLEELAAFLEQLLQFDESGAFGSISLPPDTVARMRQLVADSRDFSLSVSQSILGGSDTGSILSEHSVFKASAQKELQSSAPAKVESVSEKKTTKKFDPKDIPPQDEDVVFMEEELARLRDQVEQQQEEIFELSKRLNKDTSGASHAPNTSEGTLLSPPSPQSRKHPGTPASHYDDDDATDASWRYQDQVVVVQASDSDDILLLLNERGLPENVYFRSTWEKKSLQNKVSEPDAQLDASGKQPPPASRTLTDTAHAEDEDADESSSSSTPACRKRVAEGKESVLPSIGRFQCYSSDSDIWSEPDRSVSEQRMGGISCSGWSKHLRRSPKTPRKASGGVTRTEREEESETERKGIPTRDASWRSTESGRSKKTPQSARCQLRRLEKLLRRMQGCSAKLEDVLTSHKELCQKMLDYGNSDTSRESVEQVQLPSSELIDAHIQTMRKLQFKLEETVINNELLREILTERVESGSIIKTEMVSTSASSPEAEAAQKLQQYSKELECKERREEILKRAIANEQAAKLQLEKELLESHKELQTLHDAHSKLEESFKQYGTMPSTGFDTHLQATLREVQDWNLRLQKENEEKSHRACELEAVLKKLQAQYAELTADLQEKNIQLEFATKEVENLKGSGSHNETDELKAMLKDRVNEIEEISCTVRALHEEINHLRSEKMMLSHKLEATHRDHEVLLESSSNKISELVMKLGPLSVQNKNQLDEIRSLKEANAALQAKLDIAVSKLDALHEELEGLDLVEADHSGLNLSTNQEIPLQDKLQQVVREVQLLRKATEESRCSEAALKEETENLSTKVLRLTTQVEELEAEAEELRADQQQLEAECREAQEKEWNATKRAEEFEQMAEELKRELQGTRSKLEEMDTRCARLEKELSCSNETQQQLVSTNRELQMLLESKSDQLRAVEVSNRDLQQTLIQQGANRGLERKHVMAFQELEDQNRSLQSQVMDLRAKVDQVCHHSRLSSLEKSLHDHMHSRSLLGRYSRSPPRSSHELDGHQAHSNAPSIQEGGSLCQSRSHHTSPDLGIDSDPTPEREDGNESAPIAGGFEEHWQHRMGANWSVTSVQSAPEAVGACPLCQQQGAPENSAKGRLNWTFAGEALDHLVDESPSKNIFPSICSAPSMTGMRMCAVVELMDHELLKKRVDESICLVRRLEGTVQQLLDVLMELAPQFDEASNSKGLLQDALTGCRSIRICLVESFRLICSFTISPIPDAKDECHQRCCYENKQLKDELTSLSEKHSKQSTELQNALDQISTFKEKKEGMERAISRQLNKTKMVLKQTRGNLNVLRNKDPKPEKK